MSLEEQAALLESPAGLAHGSSLGAVGNEINRLRDFQGAVQGPSTNSVHISNKPVSTKIATALTGNVPQAPQAAPAQLHTRAASRDKILWKPTSDSTGNLVVLYPYQAGDVTIKDATTGQVLAQGQSTGASNGFADTIRFPSPGSAFNNVILEDSTGTQIAVGQGANRIENIGGSEAFGQAIQAPTGIPDPGPAMKQEELMKANLINSLAAAKVNEIGNMRNSILADQMDGQQRSRELATLTNPIVSALGGGI